MALVLAPAERSRRIPYPMPWNTTSTLRAAATNREYFYDYAGQDPINGYDLDGNCFFCSNPLGIVSAAKSAYHGAGRAWRAVAPKHWKDFFVGVWEAQDTLLIGTLTAGIGIVCIGSDAVTAGAATFICGPPVAAGGLATYLSGKATWEDFVRAYKRKHRRR